MDNILISFDVASSRDASAKVDLTPIVFIGNDIGPVAMVVGLLAGRWIPGLGQALDAVAVGGISLPIALGLLVMMYPVLAKVRYDRLRYIPPFLYF